MRSLVVPAVHLRRSAAVALAAVATLLLGVVAPAPASAVVGGRPADAGEWPWQVALLFEGQQFCGGTLLSSTHVLTAAHCTEQFEPADIEVLAGTVDLQQGGERRAVAAIHNHAQWDDFNRRFDIALLQLAEPFVLGDSIGVVTLATDAQAAELGAEGAPVVVTGFGVTNPSRPQEGSRVLMEGDVQVLDDVGCLDLYREMSVAIYGEIQVCAVGDGGAIDACWGDSGGPIVAPLDAERTRWVQLGVASWNARCGELGLPTVYTEVTTFVDWLVELGVSFASGEEFEGEGARIPARGTVGKASRYPLALDVQGFEGLVSSLSVRLVLSHSRASDLDIWLAAPDGTTVTVLSDAGGDQRFQDTEVLVLQAAGPSAAGGEIRAVVGPTDHDADPQWRSEVPAASFDPLMGVDPNGRWELLVADDATGASGRLVSWSLVLG